MLDYQQATEAHDVQAVIALFAPDIVVRSPITTRIRFEGIEQVSDLFVRIFDVITDIRFYETIGEGESSQVIFWRARVGKHYLEESNLLRLDDQGRIKEMTIFMRPVPGVLALATTLVASFAARRGPIRGAVVKAMLGGLGLVYRSGEPAVLALSGAGVKTDSPAA